MRLFVAVRPPERVLDGLVEVTADLRARADLRWVDRTELHVTLCFLGEVPDDDVPRLVAALDAAPLPVAEARMGPAVTRLGRHVLSVPVHGLETLATAVTSVTAGFGRPPEDRPFNGHVTLARSRGRRGEVDPSATGAAAEARWPVTEIVLVRSRQGQDGHHHDEIRAFRALEA